MAHGLDVAPPAFDALPAWRDVLRHTAAKPLLWAGFGLAAAFAVGATAAFDLTSAILLGAAFAVAPLVILRPASLLPVLVVAVFVQIVTVGGVTIDRLLAPLVLFVVLVALARRVASLQPGPPVWWACAYSLWAFASGLWTVSFSGTMFLLASLAIALSYMVAFATLLSSKRDLERMLYTMAGASVGVGLFGILSSEGRAQGATGDPNFFAAFEIVALPLVLALASETRRAPLRFALYGTAIVIVIAVLSSLSRGGVLTLAVVGLFVLLMPARAFLRSRLQKFVVVSVLLVATVAAFRVAPETLVPRLESVFAHEDETGSGRLNAWKAAWTSIRERPILGLGYGAYDPSANELMLRTAGVDLSNFVLRPGGLKAHSAYVGTTAELGVPGLALFLGLLFSTARAFRRTAVNARDAGEWFVMRAANAALISLLGWCVASAFLSSETSRPLWIMIGLSLALPRLVPVTRPSMAEVRQ